MKPQRIQRKRSKGWKMPPNTVYVGRPSKWGNPYSIDKNTTPAQAVEQYRQFLSVCAAGPAAESLNAALYIDLRGHDLACWCPLDQPCHADVLLELANRPMDPPTFRIRTDARRKVIQ